MFVWLSSHKLLDYQALIQKALSIAVVLTSAVITIITNVATIILAYKCALYLSPSNRSTFLSLTVFTPLV